MTASTATPPTALAAPPRSGQRPEGVRQPAAAAGHVSVGSPDDRAEAARARRSRARTTCGAGRCSKSTSSTARCASTASRSARDRQANAQAIRELSDLGIDSIHIREGVEADELRAVAEFLWQFKDTSSGESLESQLVAPRHPPRQPRPAGAARYALAFAAVAGRADRSARSRHTPSRSRSRSRPSTRSRRDGGSMR